MPKNFSKVPENIRRRLQTFSLDDVVVACAKRLKPEDVSRYSHLGMRIENGQLILPAPAVPNITAGKFSRINVEGKDIKRFDLPKVGKEFCFYAPSWGSSDTHLVCHTRQVYQLDFIVPKEVELSVTLLSKENDGFYIKFAIEEPINRRSQNFETELLYNLNILQENVGTVDVFPNEASLADYAATLRVDWEILPVDQLGVSEALNILLTGKRPVTPEQRTNMEERLKVFKWLRPTHFIYGSSGFARYFGAKYADDFVVFENCQYGNAMYVMFEMWEQLSRKSRSELLRGDRSGFERIEHKDGWENKLEAMLERYHQKHLPSRRAQYGL